MSGPGESRTQRLSNLYGVSIAPVEGGLLAIRLMERISTLEFVISGRIARDLQMA
jgi:hypothetical protein